MGTNPFIERILTFSPFPNQEKQPTTSIEALTSSIADMTTAIQGWIQEG